jgi:hypothetical protein
VFSGVLTEHKKHYRTLQWGFREFSGPQNAVLLPLASRLLPGTVLASPRVFAGRVLEFESGVGKPRRRGAENRPSGASKKCRSGAVQTAVGGLKNGLRPTAQNGRLSRGGHRRPLAPRVEGIPFGRPLAPRVASVPFGRPLAPRVEGVPFGRPLAPRVEGVPFGEVILEGRQGCRRVPSCLTLGGHRWVRMPRDRFPGRTLSGCGSMGDRHPRVRCATLGYGVKLLRGVLEGCWQL